MCRRGRGRLESRREREGEGREEIENGKGEGRGGVDMDMSDVRSNESETVGRESKGVREAGGIVKGASHDERGECNEGMRLCRMAAKSCWRK